MIQQTKPIFILYLICIFITGSLFFQSCEEDMFQPEKTEKINKSKEYEKYLSAHIRFVNEIESARNNRVNRKKIGQVNGKDVYRNFQQKFDMKLFTNVIEARHNLLRKYPKYSQIDKHKKEMLAKDAIAHSKKLSDLVSLEHETEQGFVRLKSGPNEAEESISNLGPSSQYLIGAYGSYETAYDACMNFSMNNNVESGGYIFQDASALFVRDHEATGTSMNLPVWSELDNASSTFHFQFNNPDMSPADSSALEALESYGIDSMIIITPDTIAGYSY